MHPNDLSPRNGEHLADWINRTRPPTTPEVTGQPAFDAQTGFAWRVDGWSVAIEVDEAGATVIHWHAPDGHPCIGYSLNDEGEQEAAVDVNGECTFPAWPVVAA